MRRPALPLAALVALTGCPSSHGDSTPGKDVGGPCSSVTECRSGLVCASGLCANVFAPAVTCPAPNIVADPNVVGPAQPPSGCVTDVRAPVVPLLADLGELQVGTQASFTVPEGVGVSSFSVLSQEVGGTATNAIVYQGFTIPNTVVPTNVYRPGGTLFFSDTEPLPTDAHGYTDATRPLAYYYGYTPVMGAFTSPNTAASLDLVRSLGGVPAGTWTFEVNDWAQECLSIPGCSGGSTSGRYRVQVLARSGGLRETGTLDLEIYLATDPTVSSLRTAAEAAASPDVGRMMRLLAGYYAQAGICIGDVTFHDLQPWAKQAYALGGQVDVSGTPPCDDLSQLFTLALAQKNAVHLFFADSLNAGPQTGGRTVLGVDGAIPGPSGVPGTITSGAIMGLFNMLGQQRTAGACSGSTPDLSNCGTDILAYVAAHEAGHWLGLYHTTEATGDTFDPLTDTGRCPCLSCAPISSRVACLELGILQSPTLMEATDCAGSDGTCSGGKDLMFWLLDDTISAGKLTSQQGEVMRLNPAVH